jgi:hypothetical protein
VGGVLGHDPRGYRLPGTILGGGAGRG